MARQSIPSRSGSITEEPPRGRQADTGQLEYSRARGGGTCQALGHRATWAKHRLQSTGSRGDMQGAIHVGRITPRDHLPYTRPPGPDHANSLAGILVRFRKEPVVVGCDIEGMFNQVGVDVEHRNLLRFLWWPNGDLTAEPAEYRMTTHLFGATSSPACAMHALNATADTFEDVYGEEAANFIRKDFYVDDGLTSTPDADTATRLVKDTVSMCKAGGFRLHKFVSNDPEVMKKIPPDDRSKNLQNVEIGKEDHPLYEQALGITWNASDDTLHFSVDLPKKPPTRRGILSIALCTTLWVFWRRSH